jgi:hypothetical protein
MRWRGYHRFPRASYRRSPAPATQDWDCGRWRAKRCHAPRRPASAAQDDDSQRSPASAPWSPGGLSDRDGLRPRRRRHQRRRRGRDLRRQGPPPLQPPDRACRDLARGPEPGPVRFQGRRPRQGLLAGSAHPRAAPAEHMPGVVAGIGGAAVAGASRAGSSGGAGAAARMRQAGGGAQREPLGPRQPDQRRPRTPRSRHARRHDPRRRRLPCRRGIHRDRPHRSQAHASAAGRHREVRRRSGARRAPAPGEAGRGARGAAVAGTARQPLRAARARAPRRPRAAAGRGLSGLRRIAGLRRRCRGARSQPAPGPCRGGRQSLRDATRPRPPGHRDNRGGADPAPTARARHQRPPRKGRGAPSECPPAGKRP